MSQKEIVAIVIAGVLAEFIAYYVYKRMGVK